VLKQYQYRPGMHKSRAQSHLGNYILYGCTLYLCILDMQFASCCPSGAYNFEVAPRFLENMCTPGIGPYCFIFMSQPLVSQNDVSHNCRKTQIGKNFDVPYLCHTIQNKI
jgi:hypothetical protein